MERLTIHQPRNRPSLVLQYDRPYWMSNMVGLDTIPVTKITRRGYRQEGQKRVTSIADPRPISFNVTQMADNVEDMYRYRRELIAALQKDYDYECEYENDYIHVRFTASVVVPPAFESNQAKLGTKKTCTVSMELDDPYLYAMEEIVTPMMVETPELYFPLVIPEEGIIIASMSSKRVTINNPGDVDTPVRIVFLGGSTNPSITNLTTGQIIKVNREIASANILEITTGYGNKRVWIYDAEGNKVNASHYIDSDITEYWSLVPGENELAYDADSGTDSAQVIVYWTPRLSGV